MTAKRSGALSSAFIAVLVYTLIVTLDTSVSYIVGLIDLFVTWWALTLFFKSLDEDFLVRDVK